MIEYVIGIAGQMGCGKSTLAHRLAHELDASHVTFGAFVKSQALKREMPDDRAALQDLGEMLITEWGTDRFVAAVLVQADRATVVLDGIRHLDVWRSVTSTGVNSTLVYIDVPSATRLDRMVARDINTPVAALESAMNHPMELQISALRSIADVLLGDFPREDMVAAVMNHVRTLPGSS